MLLGCCGSMSVNAGRSLERSSMKQYRMRPRLIVGCVAILLAAADHETSSIAAESRVRPCKTSATLIQNCRPGSNAISPGCVKIAPPDPSSVSSEECLCESRNERAILQSVDRSQSNSFSSSRSVDPSHLAVGLKTTYLAQWDMLEPRVKRQMHDPRDSREILIAAIALEHGTSVFTLDQTHPSQNKTPDRE